MAEILLSGRTLEGEEYCILCRRAGKEHEIQERKLTSQEEQRLTFNNSFLPWHINYCTGCGAESQPMTRTDLGM